MPHNTHTQHTEHTQHNTEHATQKEREEKKRCKEKRAEEKMKDKRRQDEKRKRRKGERESEKRKMKMKRKIRSFRNNSRHSCIFASFFELEMFLLMRPWCTTRICKTGWCLTEESSILKKEDATRYRSACMKFSCLAQDRLDFTETAKHMAQRMSEPVNSVVDGNSKQRSISSETLRGETLCQFKSTHQEIDVTSATAFC